MQNVPLIVMVSSYLILVFLVGISISQSTQTLDDDYVDPHEPPTSSKKQQDKRSMRSTSLKYLDENIAVPSQPGVKTENSNNIDQEEVVEAFEVVKEIEVVEPGTFTDLPPVEPTLPSQCGVESKFFLRYVKSVLHQLDIVGDEMLLRVNEDEKLSLKRFIAGQTNIQEATNILTVMMKSTDNIPDCLDRNSSQDYQSNITAVLQIAVIIFIVLAILLLLAGSWLYFGPKRFMLFVSLAMFCVSVPWTWVHLYKQNLAGRMSKELSNRPECNPDKLTWYQTLFPSYYEGKCKDYYETLTIDPIWEVKPTHALAVTFVELFWKPLEVMGTPLGKFISDVLGPLAWYLKPVVGIFGLLFFGLILAIIFGMRISSWFFTIEPAARDAYEVREMADAVQDLRALAQNANEDYRVRDDQLREMLDRVQNQRNNYAAIEEMLPALERMVNQFEQLQLNAPPADPQAAYQAAPPAEPSTAPLAKPPTALGQVPGAFVPLSATVKGMSDSRSFSLEFGLDRIDHIVMTVKDVDKTIKFYCKFGMRVITFKGTRKALHFGIQKINLHDAHTAEIQPTAEVRLVGSVDICLVCSCDISITQKHLKDNDIGIVVGPVDRTGAVGPIKSIYVKDPDGNLVELAHYPKCDQHVETIPADRGDCCKHT